MKTNNILVEREVGNAKLGWLVDGTKKIADLEISRLVPVISNMEDMEVIIKSTHLLGNNQPLELNGFRTKAILKSAINLQPELFKTNSPYAQLAIDHPILASFPSEVVWFGKDGLDEFKENMEWGLQKGSINFDRSKAVKLANIYEKFILESQKKYDFWSSISNNYESENLIRLLIDWTIELANLTKAKYMSGIVPIIDSQNSSSINLSHRLNLAYASIIDEKLKSGYSSPKYFYTISINPSMISSTDKSNLDEIISKLRQAISLSIFDGIYVSIRGLKSISLDQNRVYTLIRFITEINDTANEALIPIWYSRFGLLGLGLLDDGASFSSFPLNMGIGDTFSAFAPNGSPNDKATYGKVLNWHREEIQGYNEVIKYPGKLPVLEGVHNYPTNAELENSDLYRKEFAKPYNLAAMVHLNSLWVEKIKENEVMPGKDYLQRFRSPTFISPWGLS